LTALKDGATLQVVIKSPADHELTGRRHRESLPVPSSFRAGLRAEGFKRIHGEGENLREYLDRSGVGSHQKMIKADQDNEG